MSTPEPTHEGSHTGWTPQQDALLDALEVPGNRAARMMLYEAAQRTGLSPFSGQIYVALRNGWWKVETSIHGMRSVASQQAEYDGQVGPHWCGEDGQWRDVWTSKEPPVAARVGVRVKGRRGPTWGVCHFDEFVVNGKDGFPDPFWVKMPRNQVAKCAEAQAIRKEYSHILGGIYTSDEMGAAEPGGGVQAGGQVWEPAEKHVFERSAVLIEQSALEKDMSEKQRAVADALARMNATVAETDAHARYAALRAQWMKSGPELRELPTPDGRLFKEVLTDHLRQAKEEVDGLDSVVPAAPEAPAQDVKEPAEETPEEAPQEGSVQENAEDDTAAEKRPAPRKRASSPRRAKSKEPEATVVTEAEPPAVSGPAEDGEKLVLKCGCAREWVLVQGEHQKGCKKGRK